MKETLSPWRFSSVSRCMRTYTCRFGELAVRLRDSYEKLALGFKGFLHYATPGNSHHFCRFPRLGPIFSNFVRRCLVYQSWNVCVLLLCISHGISDSSLIVSELRWCPQCYWFRWSSVWKNTSEPVANLVLLIPSPQSIQSECQR